MYVSRVCTQTDRHRYRHARCICCCCWWICICICSTHLWGESELSVSVSVSVSINKSAADCSGFSLEMVKRWSNMLLNRNCCCRSLFIIGIETRLVSLCFLLSTSFYRKRRWGERQCGGGGVGIVVAGTRTCQADSFLYACVIYYPKKKKPKTCLGFLKTAPLLSSDRQFITLAAFRKRTSSIFGQPFCLYKLRVCVDRWTL